MNLERQKELMIVNGTKKKNKKRAATAKSRTSATPKRKRRSRQAAPPPAPRRARARRRNPGVDVGGTLVAAGVGMATVVALQPLLHQVTTRVSNRMVRAGLRTILPAGATMGLGLFLNRLNPSAGKAVASAGAALAALHGLSELANGAGQPVGALQKVGYAQLGAPDDVYISGGQVYRMLPDGTSQPMYALAGEAIELNLENGGTESATLLGDLGESEVLVMDQRGNLLALPKGDSSGVEGIEQADLSGGSFEVADDLGDIEADEGLSGESENGWSA
ncbi:hypothetical protein [Hyalangium versicolor]|uniref:hypothetical protein n=1 Tax=Hyalangium versicolor TaxID=2861190 RepID=UPI001CCFB38C|nr:hypothetical protein [Hyalangium versicolor]